MRKPWNAAFACFYRFSHDTEKEQSIIVQKSENRQLFGDRVLTYYQVTQRNYLIKITPISDVSNRLPIYTAGNGVAWGIPSFQRNPKVFPQGENDRNVAWQSSPKFWKKPKVAPQGQNHTHDFCGLSALLCFTPQDLEDYTLYNDYFFVCLFVYSFCLYSNFLFFFVLV
ncbi:uncharacterized protein ACOB8E_019759 isoform 2-T2 [Sarcophilus harrisii]